MMNQQEMYNYFQEQLTSHSVTLEGNKIKGKKKYATGRFSSFVITFLKENNEVSMNSGGRTLRYNNNDDLFCIMGAFSYLKSESIAQ